MKQKRLLVAVSGGVDSVALLDMLTQAGHELVVAHFDHGIRAESAKDAQFVAGLSQAYNLEFVLGGAKLGLHADEASARQARYEFLETEARKHGATITTAHHLDDLVGSVAINLARSPAWRGLAVMSRPDIFRPLLDKTKREIYEYAVKNRLEWVEDETNSDHKYLRNRLRSGTVNLPMETKQQLADLATRQRQLDTEIAAECQRLGNNNLEHPRHLYIMAGQAEARELLRSVLLRAGADSPLTQQLDLALQAIKTAKPGKKHRISNSAYIGFSPKTFVVTTSER